MIGSIVQAYTAIKNGASGVIFHLFGGRRVAVPRFLHPAAVGAFLQKEAIYTGDPWGGALDFNLHPEVFMAAIVADQGKAEKPAQKAMAIDCDDWAALATVACRQIPGTHACLLTLVGWPVQANHVVCAGTFQGQAFAIDTNGFRWLADLSQKTLCDTWGAIYHAHGFTYHHAEPVPLPF